MKTPRRILLLVLPVVACTLAACGGPPAGDVAVVKAEDGDLAVSKAQFTRFFQPFNQQIQQKEKPTPLVPPAYTACVAEKKKAIPKDSQRKPTDAALRKQCSDQYEKVRNATLDTLLKLNWSKAEAEKRGITFRKAEIARELNSIITQQFQTRKAYEAYLKAQGLKPEDIELNVVAQLAQTKIAQQIQTSQKTPNDEAVRKYFDKNKKTYTTPETRDLRLIRTSDEAKAKQALAAIKAGRSWTDVAKQYSTDETSKDQGGKVIGTNASQQPTEFASKVFKAPKNALVGPFKTSLGWYVVKVQNITPAKLPNFDQLKEQLRQALASENQQKAATDFQDEWAKRWASRTTCADDYDDLTACDKDPVPIDPQTGQPRKTKD